MRCVAQVYHDSWTAWDDATSFGRCGDVAVWTRPRVPQVMWFTSLMTPLFVLWSWSGRKLIRQVNKTYTTPMIKWVSRRQKKIHFVLFVFVMLVCCADPIFLRRCSVCWRFFFFFLQKVSSFCSIWTRHFVMLFVFLSLSWKKMFSFWFLCQTQHILFLFSGTCVHMYLTRSVEARRGCRHRTHVRIVLYIPGVLTFQPLAFAGKFDFNFLCPFDSFAVGLSLWNWPFRPGSHWKRRNTTRHSWRVQCEPFLGSHGVHVHANAADTEKHTSHFVRRSYQISVHT